MLYKKEDVFMVKKLHIKESNEVSNISTDYDYIKSCFEENGISMNLLNHVIEFDDRYYIDSDLKMAERFNKKYSNSGWKLEAKSIESPYYEEYHLELYRIVKGKKFQEACFYTLEEVEDYIDMYNKKSKESEDVIWFKG